MSVKEHFDGQGKNELRKISIASLCERKVFLAKTLTLTRNYSRIIRKFDSFNDNCNKFASLSSLRHSTNNLTNQKMNSN